MRAMVAAVSTTLNPKDAAQKGPHHLHSQRQNSTKIPLFPSESDNAIDPRKPKAREVTSRFMHSSSSVSVTKRSPSPSISRTSSLTATPTQSGSSVNKRSSSVDRRRVAVPSPSPRPYSLDFRTGNDNCGLADMPASQKLLLTSTRSLSVSFQGESFSLQVCKAKAAPAPGVRKGTPERRKSTTPARGGGIGDRAENSKLTMDQHRWPGRLRPANLMSRSLDCEDIAERKSIGRGSVSVVRQLQNSLAQGRASFDGVLSSDSVNGGLEKAAEHVVDGNSAIVSDNSNTASSDSDSVSSGSNSGAQDYSPGEGQGQRGPRGIVVPARFWQETNNRLRRENGSPLSKNVAVRTLAPSKVTAPKKFTIESPTSSPREIANSRGQLSPIRGSLMPVSPSRLLASSTAPRMRNAVGSTPLNSLSNMPLSMTSFVADARRGKIAENRIVDAHLLRLLHNRLLQWRFVNARADAAQSGLRLNAERSLYNAWLSSSRLRESVRTKRSELQSLKQKLILTSILSWQMSHLEEWDRLDQDFFNSLSGVTEALRASTLRLPVVGGAKADVQGIKDAISSAVDVLQTMASSICFLLSKVGKVNSLVNELSNVSAKECALLERVQYLLSAIAVLQVKECSLRTQILQQRCVPSI